MDHKTLKMFEDRGWFLEAVTEDSCIARCTNQTCGIMLKFRSGAEIPMRGAQPFPDAIEFTTYEGLRRALRARREDLMLSINDVEALAGFSQGHLLKGEKPNPTRKLGLDLVSAWAGALGYRLALVPASLPTVTLKEIEATRAKRRPDVFPFNRRSRRLQADKDEPPRLPKT